MGQVKSTKKLFVSESNSQLIQQFTCAVIISDKLLRDKNKFNFVFAIRQVKVKVTQKDLYKNNFTLFYFFTLKLMQTCK